MLCVYAGTSNIAVLSSVAPQESRHTRGSRGPATQGQLYQCESVWRAQLNLIESEREYKINSIKKGSNVTMSVMFISRIQVK